jgi:hypothetical protein
VTPKPSLLSAIKQCRHFGLERCGELAVSREGLLRLLGAVLFAQSLRRL